MCGRFTQRYSWDEVRAFLDLFGPAQNLAARYNIAPSQQAAVVRADPAGGRRLAMLRWGLLPGWAKDVRLAYKLINARAETIAEKPSFRAAFRARRCLIPVDGFYEWKTEGGVKQPYLITAPAGPFAFAGLWERWTVPPGSALPGLYAGHAPGEVIESFTIITTRANRTLEPIHGRMPAIIAPREFDTWLSGDDPTRLAVLLRPYDGLLRAIKVSRHVNSPKLDDPACIAPLETAG